MKSKSSSSRHGVDQTAGVFRRPRVTLLRGLREPFHRLGNVSLHSIAVFVAYSEVVFCVNVPLIGRFHEPLERLLVLPLLAVDTAHVVLCTGVTLLGRLCVPFQRRVDVLLHAVAVTIDMPNVMLTSRAALTCSSVVPVKRLVVPLRVLVENAEVALPKRSGQVSPRLCEKAVKVRIGQIEHVLEPEDVCLLRKPCPPLVPPERTPREVERGRQRRRDF
eukprot:31084-Pelagococcus_subviridis.AAC.9